MNVLNLLRRTSAPTRPVSSAEQRVAAGVTLLDERNPGWYAKIDLTKLNLQDGSYCILGQLYRVYELGLIILNDVNGIKYGFTASYRLDDDGQLNLNDEWLELDAAWRTAIITKRLAA